MADLDLDRMKEAAKAASPKWESEEHDPTEIRIRVSGGNVHGYTCFVSTRWCHPSQNAEQRANAAYLIAAQPSAVLSLIERMEEAEAVQDQFNGVVEDRNAENATLRADLAEAVEALRPWAGIGVGTNPDYAPMIRLDRRAILAARAIVAKHKEPTHG